MLRSTLLEGVDQHLNLPCADAQFTHFRLYSAGVETAKFLFNRVRAYNEVQKQCHNNVAVVLAALLRRL